MPLHEISGTGLPPGFELDYVENTSAVAVTSLVEATPDTVITSNNLTVNGSTTVMVEFGARGIVSPTTSAGFLILNLHISTDNGSNWTDIGRLAAVQNNSSSAANTGLPCFVARRHTPSAGTAKYRIVSWVSSINGTPTVQSGAGGAGTGMPMFIRVTRV